MDQIQTTNKLLDLLSRLIKMPDHI